MTARNWCRILNLCVSLRAPERITAYVEARAAWADMRERFEAALAHDREFDCESLAEIARAERETWN
jgi:hypothetical protein